MGIYQIGAKWYIDLYVDGRRKRKAIGSRKEAENALTAIKADVLRGEFKFKRESKVQFEAFAQEYLAHCKTNKKKSWQRDENSIQFLEVHFGGMLLSKITPLDIEDYKSKRINGEIKLKPKPGASRSRKDWKVQPATINRELACLKHMFSLAKKWKMADENPVKEVQFFQERQIEMKILSREEIERLVAFMSPRLKPIVIVALNTGMRKGEILHLRWSDIDFENQFIFLKETKSNRSRKIPMSGLVAETLRAMRRDKEFVFTNPRTGRPLSDLQSGFKTACRKAAVGDLRFHDLRHTAATYMVTGGIDLVTVKEILGHATIQMTMRYAHPTPENKRHAVEVLATLFGQKKEETNLPRTKDQIEIRATLPGLLGRPNIS
jgi:integrase